MELESPTYSWSVRHLGLRERERGEEDREGAGSPAEAARGEGRRFVPGGTAGRAA